MSGWYNSLVVLHHQANISVSKLMLSKCLCNDNHSRSEIKLKFQVDAIDFQIFEDCFFAYGVYIDNVDQLIIEER